MKKILSVVIVVFLVALMQVSVFADVLEIDTASAEFKADTWQNNVENTTSNEVCPLINAIAETAITTNAGVVGTDIYRYCGCLQSTTANIEGGQVFVNGSATTSMVFPLKETANIDSFSLKFNNATRQFFFNVYTSTDGKNWTEATVSSGATKVTLDNSYDEAGATAGPGGIVCNATIPAGEAADKDINIITLGIAGSPEASYLKITAYGNDGGTGTATVSNPWWSFNNFKIEGSIVVPVIEEVVVPVETAAPAETAPAATTAPAPVKAPQTSDSIYIFGILALVGIAGFVTYTRKIKE